MALSQINPGRGQQPKESTLDKVLKAVQIAQGVMGTAIAIPEFLQKRDVMKGQQEGQKSEQALREAQINKINAEVGGIQADNTPLSDEQRSAFVQMGVPEMAVPQTVGAARDIASKMIETPQQKASRENQDRMFGATMKNLELSGRAAARADEQFSYSKQKDAEEKAKKEQERFEELYVPGLGLAFTTQDAKDLKDGLEAKQSFDRKIDQLIELRKKYGGEVFDRAAVAQAKQISTDLLFIKKNMEKLGVLSSGDQKLVDAVIPRDPLGFSPNPLGSGDPIMKQLESLKENSTVNFTDKVKTRIKEKEQLKTQDAPETKVVNGVEYVRVPGGWQRK